MVAGDPIKGERKFEHSFDFYPTAKHVYSANAFIPVSDAEMTAFIGRWIIIPLFNVYRALPQGAENAGIQEPDTMLIDKLATPENLSEMLNLALDGLRRL